MIFLFVFWFEPRGVCLPSWHVGVTWGPQWNPRGGALCCRNVTQHFYSPLKVSVLFAICKLAQGQHYNEQSANVQIDPPPSSHMLSVSIGPQLLCPHSLLNDVR